MTPVSIRRIFVLGAFAMGAFLPVARRVAAQTPSPALLISLEDAHALALADPPTDKIVVGGVG